MATKGDTFERKEKKYLVTSEQCAAVKAGLAARMRLDDYGATRIDSLYLDTPDHDLICRSLEKPLYKEKLRIRSYGAFSEADTVYVEIKKKYKGIVYKRRVRMSKNGYELYLAGASYEEATRRFPAEPGKPDKDLKPGNIQIAREIDAFFKRHPGLAPAMVIRCMREAWCPLDPDDADCVDRITFDEDITYVDLMDGSSAMRRRVAAPGQVVMEIKCAGGYPLWLAELLSAHDVYPRSFSKYGNAFKRTLASAGAVDLRDSDAGKVAVRGIPFPHARRDADEVLLGPSEGFEVA